MNLFDDRRAAGRALAEELRGYRGSDAQVLGVVRGGVPVAYEVARILGQPLDVIHVQRFFLREHPDVVLGAVASGGIQIVNPDAIHVWSMDDAEIASIAAEAALDLHRREIRRRRTHRMAPLAERDVILVDDGMATGAAMRAAIACVRRWEPRRVVAAVPVAAADSCAHLTAEADEFVCPHCSEEFIAVGEWYERFDPVGDGEVDEYLERARRDGGWRSSGAARPVGDLLE